MMSSDFDSDDGVESISGDDRLHLTRECAIDFKDWLGTRIGISELSCICYVKYVSLFLRETSSIRDPEEYNRFLVNHTVKKRSNVCKFALKKYVEFKFRDKSSKRLKDSLIDAMRYVRHKAKTPLRTPKVLSDADIKKIMKNLNVEKHRVVAEIQFALGVRAGDVLRVEVGDVDYELYKGKSVMAIVFRGKGDKRYKMWVFDENLQKKIEKYVAGSYVPNSTHLFLDVDELDKHKSVRAYQLAYHRYSNDLKQAVFRSGVGTRSWNTHDFRRNIARKLWEKYHDIMIVKEFLHHDTIVTTSLYLRGMGLEVQDVQESLFDDAVKSAGGSEE